MFNWFKKTIGEGNGWEIAYYPLVNKFRPRYRCGSEYRYIKHIFAGQRSFYQFESNGESMADYFENREDCLKEIALFKEQQGRGVIVEKLS